MNRRTFLFGALSAAAGFVCPPVRKIFVMPGFVDPRQKIADDFVKWKFRELCENPRFVHAYMDAVVKANTVTVPDAIWRDLLCEA